MNNKSLNRLENLLKALKVKLLSPETDEGKLLVAIGSRAIAIKKLKEKDPKKDWNKLIPVVRNKRSTSNNKEDTEKSEQPRNNLSKAWDIEDMQRHINKINSMLRDPNIDQLDKEKLQISLDNLLRKPKEIPPPHTRNEEIQIPEVPPKPMHPDEFKQEHVYDMPKFQSWLDRAHMKHFGGKTYDSEEEKAKANEAFDEKVRKKVTDMHQQQRDKLTENWNNWFDAWSKNRELTREKQMQQDRIAGEAAGHKRRDEQRQAFEAAKPKNRNIPDANRPLSNETQEAHRARLQTAFNANPAWKAPGITQAHMDRAINAAWDAGPKEQE